MPGFDDRYREEVWSGLAGREWDVVVVGGGITGAGVAREAARAGLSVLLLEAGDFASGTSGKSSKMIHGGLRYLKERQIKLTREAVRERENLLRQGPGLVEPLEFLYAVYNGDRPGPWTLEFGLTVYDLLKRSRKTYHTPDALDVSLVAPNLSPEGLRGAFRYADAGTDDARLVFRMLREAARSGARVLNYARVEELLRDASGAVRAVAVRDAAGDAAGGATSGATAEARAEVVVDATGAWSGELGGTTDLVLRPLRGSHLVFPWERFPTAGAVTFAHPEDGRPVFAYPWEGVTLVGTTDLDHDGPAGREPRAAPEEVDYLLAGVRERFDDAPQARDLLGTFAGVRPVVSGGREDPSREPRECVVRTEGNLVTVAGGKLTTFHPTAHEVLRAVTGILGVSRGKDETRSLDPVPQAVAAEANEVFSGLPHLLRRRLVGRLGPDLEGFLGWVGRKDLEPVPGTPYVWAELVWAARNEGVLHLEDLLLRRVRLGHLLPEGGAALRDEIEERLRPHAGWSPQRWWDEWERHRRLWQESCAPAVFERQA